MNPIAVVLAATGPIGGPDARRVARAELAHRQYRTAGPSLLARFLHWLENGLGEIRTGNLGTGSGALLILLVVFLVVLVAVALRAGVPRRRARAAAATDMDPLATLDAAEHRRRAGQLTRDRRLDEALREWLRATIATVEERGVLHPRPGRTGASTAREAGPLLPAAATDLLIATRAFDEVWFGARTATDDDVAAARRAADAVRGARISADTSSGHNAHGLAVPR